MTTPKKTYKNPKVGTPLISAISTGCKTPLLEIKFCNLLKPFYYPNSPAIARYSITCLIDPEKDKEFLHGIQSIEKNEKVETVIKNDSIRNDEGKFVFSGKLLIKFQSKEIIPVYMKGEEQEPEEIILEDELAKGEKVIVTYDILRYTKKNTATTEHGISFKPSYIYYYPSPEKKEKANGKS